MPVDPTQLSQDKDFLAAGPDDQIKFLSAQDPDFAKAPREDQMGYLSHVTGKPYAAPVVAPQKLDLSAGQPSTWGVLTQPTEKTDKEYLGYRGLPGVVGATIHGLNNVARGTTDALAGGLNTIKTAARAWNDPHADVGDTVLPDPHFEQIPGAIHDINQSPDPTGAYLKVAGDTAAQGAGQALTALGLDAASDAVGPAAEAVKKAGRATKDVVAGAAKASGIGLSPIEKLVKAAGPSVRDANFPQHLETAAPELARQNAATPVKSVQDMADAAHSAADSLWKNQIEPQITRNASATINGDSVARSVRSSIDEGMADLFPEQAKAANSFADKFQGELPLSKANTYLKTLNAQLKGFYKMSPEARAAAGVTDGRISAMESAADNLRSQMYEKLDSLGETDPAGLRQQYGALKQVQSVFGKRAIVSGHQAPLNLPQVLGMTGGAIEAANQLGSGHPIGALAAAGAGTLPTIFKFLNSPDMLVKRGISGLPAPEPLPNTLTLTSPGDMPPATQRPFTFQGGPENTTNAPRTVGDVHTVPGPPDLNLTPSGQMPSEAQRPFSFMDNPNTAQSGPVAPGGTGVGPTPPPPPNAFDVDGLRSKLTPRWDPSKAFDVSELRRLLQRASEAEGTPRSLGAAAAEPAVEQIPQRLRELLGLEKRATPRTAPMSATELEAAIKNRKPVSTPFDQTEGAMNTIANDPNMPKHPTEMAQGGHAGKGVASIEELSRPGKNYVVDQHGRLTYHGKEFAPEDTPKGAAHVTVLPDGSIRVNEGTMTPSMEAALKKGLAQ